MTEEELENVPQMISAKMAAQQEMLRNELQKMMNEMMKNGTSGSLGDLKNISRDQNDTREHSYENWKENNATNNSSTNQQSIEDYEKSLFEASGGESKRETILKEMEQRKNDQKNDQN